MLLATSFPILAARNGDLNWRLPVPATFIVAQGGLIRFAHVDPDFRRRLDAETIRGALRRLFPAGRNQSAMS